MSGARQLIGGIVGATIGFFIGGPTGAAIGFNIGSAIGASTEEGPTVEGPRLTDLKVQRSTYGSPLPFMYGAMRMAGTLMWVKQNKIQERRIEEDQGGKGGGGAGTVVTYEYYGTFAIALCEGPIGGVRKIWADSVLIYSATNSQTARSVYASGSASANIDIYTGSTTQEPNGDIEADVGTAPAYRGIAYIVIKNLKLEKYGNRIPNITAEVISEGTGGFTYLELLTPNDPDPPDGEGGSRSYMRLLDNTTQTTYTEGHYGNGQGLDLRTRIYRRPLTDGYLNYEDTNLPGNADYATTHVPIHYAGDGDYIMFKRTGSPGDAWLYSRAGDTGSFSAAAHFAAPPSSSWNAGIGTGIAFIEGNHYTQFNASDSTLIRSRIYLVSAGAVTTSSTTYDLTDYVTGTPVAAYLRNEKLHIVTSSGYVAEFYCPDDSTYLAFTSEFLPTNSTTYSTSLFGLCYLESTNLLWVASERSVWRINLTTQLQEYIGDTDEVPVTTNESMIAVRNGLFLHAYQRGVYCYATGSLTAGTVSLQTVVADLCTRSGLSASDIDVSALGGTVSGFIHTKVGSAVADLVQLQRAFRFDAVQSEYKIKFVPRGSSSIVTLTESDLAAHEYGQDRPSLLEMSRALETKLPQRVNVGYVNADRAYDANEQYAERLITQSDRIEKVELAISLTDEEAAEIAEILLYEAWVSREQFTFSLPVKYSYIEPADIVTITVDSGTYRIRVESVEFGSPYLLKLTGSADAVEVYTSAAEGSTGYTDDQEVLLASPTTLNMLDIPILRDEDDNAGWYYAVHPTISSDWPGVSIYVSSDSGETYSMWDSASTASCVGYTTGALASHETLIPDETNTVTVRLLTPDATLSSVTYANLLAGSNLCVIGSSGRWEVLSFQNATLNSDGTYTLDTFIRGQRGTEHAVGNHQSGDTFVFLSLTTIYRNSSDASLIGSARTYYPVTRDTLITDTSGQSFTNTAVGLTPYSVIKVQGTRDGSGNLTITWTRRGRLANEWIDGANVPVGEESEAYEVDILDGGSPDTVLRTLEVSSPTASYTAAQQATDFGSAQSSILIRVYQISATVGRGYETEATV